MALGIGIGISSTFKKSGFDFVRYWTTLMVQHFDGTIVGSELIDKSPLGLNAALTTNQISNPGFEHDYNYANCNNPTSIAISAEQAHGGSSSLKVISNGEVNSGAKILTSGTITGKTYTIGMWVYLVSTNAAYIGVYYYNKYGSYLGGEVVDLAKTNQWQYITTTFIETHDTGGAVAGIVIYPNAGNSTFYVDDVTLVNNTDVESYVILQENAAISAHDTGLVFYTAGGFAKTKLITGLPLNSNDKVFYGATNNIIIYNQQTDAKMLEWTLNLLGGAYTIDKYFTGERTIEATNAAKHYGFGVTLFVGNRMYAFYRDGRSHTSDDGKAVYRYSDDNGLTWSAAADLYTGAEILTDNPDFSTDHPGCKVDVRDLRGIVLANGNVVILADAVVCLNDTPPPDTNIDVINVYEAFAVCLMIPASGSTLVMASMTISYLPATVRTYVGDIKEKAGILYATTWYNAVVKLHTSSNFGITWTTVSTVFNRVNATENGLCFVGDVLYCVHRMDIGTDAYVARSYDYGATWEDETLIAINIHWPELLATNDGKILVYGRNYGSAIIDIYKLDGVAVSGSEVTILATYTNDCAYGNISKKNGVYYFCYHNGPIKAAPNLYGLSSAAFCYKAIVGTHIEDF